ncbi:MAG: hypothetical protein MJ181_10115 [Treponema sp.]|nr:hypothetical protein [Treponema sp.]
MNKQCEVCIQQTQEEIKLLKAQIEKLLYICIDKGIVSSWYYNGAYHWELDDFNMLFGQVKYRNKLILNSYRIDNIKKLREVLQDEKWRKKLGKKFCKDLDEVYAKHMKYKLTN